MIQKPFDARAFRFVEDELRLAVRSVEIDADERSGKTNRPPSRGIIPAELYDENATGEAWVFVVHPNDSLEQVVRSILSARTPKARSA